MSELRVIDGQIAYAPDGKVLRQFVIDRSEVAVIVGPIGSGTSTAAMMRMWQTACGQKKNPRDGVRRTRWGVIRPTYPELHTSTLKTWLYWFPEARYGAVKWSRPLKQVLTVGDVEAEMWFLALDGPDDIEKIKSTEWTGFFLNELEYQSYEIFHECRSRSKRYPAVGDGGTSWSGLIADMNAPREDHFIARMAGWSPYPDDTPEEKRIRWPAGWKLYRQPPGLLEVKDADGVVTGYRENPDAENAKWLAPGYYSSLAEGATRQWIDARIMNRVQFISTGDPVWRNFRPEVHVARQALPYREGREVIVACDFGRRPTALIGQEVGLRLEVQREFRLYGVSASIFAPALKRLLEQHYRGAAIKVTGDPKGADKSQATEHSAHDIMASYGLTVINPMPGRGNDLQLRLEAVSYALMTDRILVSPDCSTLVAALSGKYVIDNSDAAHPEPMKRGEAAKYSDVADALQYMLLFLGEGRRLIGLTAAKDWTAMKVMKARSLRRVRG